MKDKRLLIIFVTVFIDLVGFGIIIPLSPYLAKTYGATPLQVGLLMSIYSLMQFVFSPMWGQLSDRWGRRPIILISLFGAGISHIAFAFGDSLMALMMARAFAGIFGGNIPAAMAYVADITESKDRSKSMGLIGAAFGLGFILGPAIGGLTSQWSVAGFSNGGFPAIVAGCICLLNALAALKFLPESHLVRGKAQFQGRFVRWKKLWAAMTKPTLNVLMIVSFLAAFGLAHVEASLFLFMDKQFGWSQAQSSYGFAYIGLIMVMTQGFLIRKLMPKFGEASVLLMGLLLASLGLGMIGILGEHFLPVVLGVTLIGLGNGMANPAINGSVSLLSGRDEQGNNLGVNQSLASMARILGPPSGGFLFAQMTSAPFLAGAIALFFGFVLALAIRSKLPMAAYGKS